jgi:hypothetical protein
MVAVAAIITALTPGVAHADLSPAGHLVEYPMRVIGYDRDVAAKNGYEIRIDASGAEYSAKVGSPEQPADERVGDCGWSWVYFTAVDTRTHFTSIYTGWRLLEGLPGAWDFNWNVHVTDLYGVSDKHWGNPIPSYHNWAAANAFQSGGPGPANATVTVGLVFLTNGTICFAYGPTAHADL